MEKHFLPAFELVVTMPAFLPETAAALEASVDGAFITERIAKGNVSVAWLAKKTDYQTPMFNESVVYRKKHAFRQKIANIYHDHLYHHQVEKEEEKEKDVEPPQPYADPHRNASFGPGTPPVEEWTIIRRDFQMFRLEHPAEPFSLYLDEIETVMGTRSGIQVRIGQHMTGLEVD